MNARDAIYDSGQAISPSESDQVLHAADEMARLSALLRLRECVGWDGSGPPPDVVITGDGELIDGPEYVRRVTRANPNAPRKWAPEKIGGSDG